MSAALLLDAHVWIAARDADDVHHATSRSLVTSGAELRALDLTLYEVANAAQRRFGGEAARALLGALDAAVAGAYAEGGRATIVRATELAEAHRLTAYDAAYVAVAEREGWKLVSGDRDLVAPGLAVEPGAALREVS